MAQFSTNILLTALSAAMLCIHHMTMAVLPNGFNSPVSSNHVTSGLKTDGKSRAVKLTHQLTR